MTISPKLRAALVATWLVSSITYLVLVGVIHYGMIQDRIPVTADIAPGLLGASIAFSLVFIAERITMRAARAETTTP